jgi:copper chaperone
MTHAEVYPRWEENVVFGSEGPRHKKLLQTEGFRAVLVGLEAGQSIPPHPSADAAYHFLEGTGWMVVDGKRLPVETGATVVVPGGVPRGIEAETRLAFLGTHGSSVAKSAKLKPFMGASLMTLLGVAIMLGLMIAGMGPMALMLSGGLNLGLGMWSVMLVPVAGLIIMLLMMFFFFRWMRGGGGPMARMAGHAGLMREMMTHEHAHEPASQTQSKANGNGMNTLTYTIPDVNCGHCKMTVERELSELAGVAAVSVDVDARQAVIQYDAPATPVEIEALLTEIGYPPKSQ